MCKNQFFKRQLFSTCHRSPIFKIINPRIKGWNIKNRRSMQCGVWGWLFHYIITRIVLILASYIVLLKKGEHNFALEKENFINTWICLKMCICMDLFLVFVLFYLHVVFSNSLYWLFYKLFVKSKYFLLKIEQSGLNKCEIICKK